MKLEEFTKKIEKEADDGYMGAVRDLLLTFLADTYEDDVDDKDEATIRRYVDESNTKVFTDLFKEAEELLSVEPFPWKWFSSLSNRIPDPSVAEYSQEGYKKWFLWMLDEITKEAKKVGKL